MPVLVTIATVTYLSSSGSKGARASFLDPAALREKLEKLPEGSNCTEVLGIVDQLDTLAREYDDATDAAMSAYIADVDEWSSSADELIEVLLPLDRLRRKTLEELIRLRQRLVDALSPAEWDEVFG